MVVFLISTMHKILNEDDTTEKQVANGGCRLTNDGIDKL